MHCLLGDNGAGKSTLIKILSGVHRAEPRRDPGRRRAGRTSARPRDALDRGIATVYQDLGAGPADERRAQFFLGREPAEGLRPVPPLRHRARQPTIAREAIAEIGIDAARSRRRPVGTLSGGERQCVAIARAVYFGAKVLILDEPTSALGVHQASIVLKFVAQARARGIGVIFITHNVHHAYAVGDRFTLLNRGRSIGTYAKAEITRDELTRHDGRRQGTHRSRARAGSDHAGQRRTGAAAAQSTFRQARSRTSNADRDTGGDAPCMSSVRKRSRRSPGDPLGRAVPLRRSAANATASRRATPTISASSISRWPPAAPTRSPRR